MRRSILALAGIVILTAAPVSAQPGQQFDLICDVDVVAWKGTPTNVIETRKDVFRWSIDLDKRTWFNARVADPEIVPFHSITDRDLVLMSSESSQIRISRVTGHVCESHDWHLNGRAGFTAQGTCRPGEFTPVPRPIF